MKNLKNLGQALSKAEQQSINGGRMALINVVCYRRIDETQPCAQNYHVSNNDETKGQCCANL
jgi:hypothetical protein